jgi:hypothetical protein
MRYLLFLFAIPALFAQTSVEGDVLRLLNEARTAPARFAATHLRSHINDSREAAECYREMGRLQPMAALRISPVLMKSTAAHANDTGRAGIIGHTGADGSRMRDRVERYGTWRGSIAENVSYGNRDPLQIVLDLLIDEGVAGRGHRRNMLNPSFAYVGIAVRTHRSWGHQCVMDFASHVESTRAE